MDRRELLGSYLDEMAGREVEYGVNDCCMFPAQWLSDITGKDLEIPKYQTMEQAHKLIEEAGSLADLWSGILAPVGIFERSGDSVYGDVGVVRTRAFGDVGVIFLHLGQAIWRTLDGTSFICPRQKTIQRMWEVK